MSIYVYPNNTETEITNLYVGIPNPESITLDKSSISLTTVGQTAQLTATLTPTVCDQRITWTTSDSTVATVSTTGLVTCVTPGTCTITATTSNGLTATCSVGQSRLPAEYQEVEWIGGTGLSGNNSMWIDTGVNTTSSVGAYTKMYKIGTKDNDEFFYSNTNGSTSRRGMVTYPSGNWCPQWETWIQTNVAYNTQQWYEIKFNYENNRLTLIDNTNIYTMTNATFNSNTNCFIGRCTRGSTSYGWRCAFFKMTDGSTLIRDFVPCYRIADGVIGMYDLVNDQFYTNAGSGTFTKGNDV